MAFEIKNNNNEHNKSKIEEEKENAYKNDFSKNIDNNNNNNLGDFNSDKDQINTYSHQVGKYPENVDSYINNIESENEVKDMLDFLFVRQKELYKKQLSNSENKMKNLYETREPFNGYRIFMLSSALVHEAIELQRETNWKWWKKEKDIDIKKIQEEIIDIWHFLIQLSIESGLDSKKLIEIYIKKNEENLNRQKRGY
jgi:dimeric dUTPase (all-alpha-NTP-PPase superfamily)